MLIEDSLPRLRPPVRARFVSGQPACQLAHLVAIMQLPSGLCSVARRSGAHAWHARCPGGAHPHLPGDRHPFSKPTCVSPSPYLSYVALDANGAVSGGRDTAMKGAQRIEAGKLARVRLAKRYVPWPRFLTSKRRREKPLRGPAKLDWKRGKVAAA